MTGLNHGITGAVIALTIKQPILAVPLAFLSHFAIDMIPHWDYGKRYTKGKLFGRRYDAILVSDFVLSLMLMAVLAVLFPNQIWLIWACMIAAASPDLMWAYYRLYQEHIKKRKVNLGPIARIHHKIQWSESYKGLYVEVVWFVIFFGFILSRYYSITMSLK